ncbi:unnamed protein product [Amoebophrya sp. A25]|nr:unnamed protein product [Amoebophrya sp. A25]|eukprot:GSA25T00020960001.1
MIPEEHAARYFTAWLLHVRDFVFEPFDEGTLQRVQRVVTSTSQLDEDADAVADESPSVGDEDVETPVGGAMEGGARSRVHGAEDGAGATSKRGRDLVLNLYAHNGRSFDYPIVRALVDRHVMEAKAPRLVATSEEGAERALGKAKTAAETKGAPAEKFTFPVANSRFQPAYTLEDAKQIGLVAPCPSAFTVLDADPQNAAGEHAFADAKYERKEYPVYAIANKKNGLPPAGKRQEKPKRVQELFVARPRSSTAGEALPQPSSAKSEEPQLPSQEKLIECGLRDTLDIFRAKLASAFNGEFRLGLRKPNVLPVLGSSMKKLRKQYDILRQRVLEDQDLLHKNPLFVKTAAMNFREKTWAQLGLSEKTKDQKTKDEVLEDTMDDFDSFFSKMKKYSSSGSKTRVHAGDDEVEAADVDGTERKYPKWLSGIRFLPEEEYKKLTPTVRLDVGMDDCVPYTPVRQNGEPEIDQDLIKEQQGLVQEVEVFDQAIRKNLLVLKHQSRAGQMSFAEGDFVKAFGDPPNSVEFIWPYQHTAFADSLALSQVFQLMILQGRKPRPGSGGKRRGEVAGESLGSDGVGVEQEGATAASGSAGAASSGSAGAASSGSAGAASSGSAGAASSGSVSVGASASLNSSIGSEDLKTKLGPEGQRLFHRQLTGNNLFKPPESLAQAKEREEKWLKKQVTKMTDEEKAKFLATEAEKKRTDQLKVNDALRAQIVAKLRSDLADKLFEEAMKKLKPLP